MKNTRGMTALILVGGLVISALVILYYWSVKEYLELKKVPVYVMILLIGYIVLQLLKRMLTKQQNWYDWLYYIGLASVAVPVFLATPSNFDTYLLISQLGTLFLAIPLLIEGYFLNKPKV